MAMALAMSNEFTATLVFDGRSLDFALDVDSSIEATRTRVERGQSSSDIYLEAHICVRRSEADPTTRLFISEQDAGEFGFLLSRFLNLIDAAGMGFLDFVDGKSLSELIREKSSLAYSTDRVALVQSQVRLLRMIKSRGGASRAGAAGRGGSLSSNATNSSTQP